MISDALFALLNGKTVAGSRVFPIHRPQRSELPAIVYQEISGAFLHTNNGGSPTSMSRWQITAFASSYRTANTLLDDVRRIFDGYRGTIGGIEIQHIITQPETRRDVPAQHGDIEQLDCFAKSQDYQVMANELQPNQ